MRAKYCGYYSNFNLYPDMHIFLVTITLTLRKPFDLKAIFSVTDNKLIVNPVDVPKNEKTVLFFFQFLCYKVTRKYYLRSFLVSTVKFHRVQIYIVNSQKNNYVIYDGPGYRFDILNKKGGKSHFVTSTFQCLLQFLLTYLFQWEISNLFWYQSIHNNNEFIEKINFKSENVTRIPNARCLSNFCVHIFVQPKGFYLNVTVLSVNVSSPETSYCLYQGLYLGEIWKYRYTTID